VSGSYDNTLKVWDLERGRCLKTLRGHKGGVDSVVLTPDGSRAVSGSGDTTLKVWEVETGRCLKTLRGHVIYWGRTTKVAVAPDGRKAVSKSGDRTPRVWDLDTGLCVGTLKGHMGYITSVVLTPDGKRIVSGSEDGTVRVWDLETGDCLSILEEEGKLVSELAITPDGRRVVSESRDRTVEVRDTAFAFGREERHGFADPTLQVWDLVKRAYVNGLQGHKEWVSLAITPDGSRVVSGSRDSTLRVWDLEKGRCLAIYDAAAEITDPRLSVNWVIACGTHSGDVLFSKYRGIDMQSPMVTPIRMWVHAKRTGLLGRWLAFHTVVHGRWDDAVKTVCAWCGGYFTVAEEILNVICGINRQANLSPDQSPCLELPDEAWEEPRLLSECPLCHKPLKFNPFIVDNRDRY